MHVYDGLRIAGVVGGLLLGGGWSTLVHGQGLDCRIQACSVEDLKDALCPPRLRAMTVVNTHRNIPITPSSVTMNINFLEDSDTILPDFYHELEKLGTLLTDPGLQEMRCRLPGIRTISVLTRTTMISLYGERAM